MTPRGPQAVGHSLGPLPVHVSARRAIPAAADRHRAGSTGAAPLHRGVATDPRPSSPRSPGQAQARRRVAEFQSHGRRAAPVLDRRPAAARSLRLGRRGRRRPDEPRRRLGGRRLRRAGPDDLIRRAARVVAAVRSRPASVPAGRRQEPGGTRASTASRPLGQEVGAGLEQGRQVGGVVGQPDPPGRVDAATIDSTSSDGRTSAAGVGAQPGGDRADQRSVHGASWPGHPGAQARRRRRGSAPAALRARRAPPCRGPVGAAHAQAGQHGLVGRPGLERGLHVLGARTRLSATSTSSLVAK